MHHPKRFFKLLARKIHPNEPTSSVNSTRVKLMAQQRTEYCCRAQEISRRHQEQTLETVAALNKKYEKPIFGKVSVWSLVERLGQCIDPSDRRLFATNQQVHVLQILEGMEQDGVSDPDLILAALIHDLGKTLLLTDEAPENIVGFNSPVYCENGIGLDNCIFQWNHDELGYLRLKDYIPDHLAWLVRYHSIKIEECIPFMNERDRNYTNHYLQVFSKYDHDTKSIYNLPKKKLKDYQSLIEKAFPEPIWF